MCKIPLATVHNDITHRVRELCELRDHVNTCELVSSNMIHVVLGESGRLVQLFTS